MDGMEGRAAAAISRMEQVRREMAERRALRQRHSAEIRAKSRASLEQHGRALGQAVTEAAEAARRQRAAGGWSTEKIHREQTHVMGLGIQEEEEGPAGVQPAGHRPPPAVTPPRREGPARFGPPVEDEDKGVPIVPTPHASPDQAHRPAERRRRPPAPRPPDDDDDFFNPSTWMVQR